MIRIIAVTNIERQGKDMNKLETLIDVVKSNERKMNELLHKKEKEEEKKKSHVLLWALAIVGAIAAVAAIAYFVYRYMRPDYLEDFEDEFEDDFEDEFEDDEFEDEKPEEK